ncbi:hypothetical protein CVT24_012213 [Panaeolus cyanescens]|uniref:YMC020W-like alpha/beta hydrolase domain-containing protein n=1 Tax=Panaeolus cyanescens TaxID=181874 RepID=A0A409YIT7_9AGAR|nr:hypothetical protein CVT24_012213 [Panaeolus cyanescens]
MAPLIVRSATTGLPIFPVEIFREIITHYVDILNDQFCREDLSDSIIQHLITLSLVSPVFQQLAKRHFFNDVRFTREEFIEETGTVGKIGRILDHYHVTSKDEELLFPSLTELTLNACFEADPLQWLLHHSPNLQYLCLKGLRLANFSVTTTLELPKLEQLYLTWAGRIVKESAGDLVSCFRCPRLKVLNMHLDLRPASRSLDECTGPNRFRRLMQAMEDVVRRLVELVTDEESRRIRFPELRRVTFWITVGDGVLSLLLIDDEEWTFGEVLEEILTKARNDSSSTALDFQGDIKSNRHSTGTKRLMNDNPTTAATPFPESSTSEFRPITPPLNANRAAFGPPPPTYESHYVEPMIENGDPASRASCGELDVNEAQPQAQKAVASSSQNPTPIRKPRSRKSSTLSTTSVRTSRSTLGRGASTWRPGAPFLSSSGGGATIGTGGDGRAVVSAVTVNAAGAISGVDDAINPGNGLHTRSKTTSAVALPSSLDLSPPTFATMTTSASASATLDGANTPNSNTLSVPPTPATPSSPSELRLSPSISRLRSIANTARRRESLSSPSQPSSPVTGASHSAPQPQPIASSSSAPPATTTEADTTTSSSIESTVVPPSHDEPATKEEQRKHDAPESIMTNDQPLSSTPFKSRIPTASAQRKRTISSSSASHIGVSLRSQALKALPVTQESSVMKMGEIVSEGVGVGLVGVMSGVVGGVGEVVGMRGGVGGKGKEREKTREVGKGKEREREELAREREKDGAEGKGKGRAMDLKGERQIGNAENKERQSDLSSSRSSPPSKLPRRSSTLATSPNHRATLLPSPMPSTSSSTPVKRTPTKSKSQDFRKDWFSSLTRAKGKSVASVGVAIVQSESEAGAGETEERDVRVLLEGIQAAQRAVEEVAKENERGEDVSGGKQGGRVEINVLPATPQVEHGLPVFVSESPPEARSSSISLPLPVTEEHVSASLTSQSSPSLPLKEETASAHSLVEPPSPTRSTPRTISHSRSVSHTPTKRKSKSWFSSPLSGSPLGVSVFTASREDSNSIADEITESPSSDTGPPTYIPPPPAVEDENVPPSYPEPPPPPVPIPVPGTPPKRSDSLPSLDSVVPSLPATPPVSGHGRGQGEGGKPLLARKSSSASLNASSGRFLLSFGLPGILGMGREKVEEKGKENLKRQDEVVGGVPMERTESEETTVPRMTSYAVSEAVSLTPSVDDSTLQDSSRDGSGDEDLSATIRWRPEKSEKAAGKEKERDAEEDGQRTVRDTSKARNANGWWGMVGWGGGVVAAKEDEGKNVEDEPRTGESQIGGDEVKEDGGEERQGDEGTVKASSIPEGLVEDNCDVKEAKMNEDVGQKGEEPGHSKDMDKEGGLVVGSAAWFARWTWYSSGEVREDGQAKKEEANIGAEAENVVDGSEVQTEVEGTQETEDNDNETETEQAVVRSSDPPSKSSTAIEYKNAKVDDNPLTSTMSTAAQRSLWSTIFSSTYAKTVNKTGSMKAIEDGRALENVERDEHGAEVMDIESDEESAPPMQPKSPERQSRGWAGPMRMMVAAVSSSSSRDASVERRQPNASGPRNPVSQNGKDSDITGSSATTTTLSTTTPYNSNNMSGDGKDGKNGVKDGQGGRMRNGKGDTSAQAATSSTTTASSSSTTKTVGTISALTKRTASPAPSTTSSTGASTSKSNGPPPPNLVLPTWEDTFFVPPRSYVDPPPPKSAASSRVGSPGEEGLLSKGLIGGALRLVSGVLGSPQQPPPPPHPSSHASGSKRRAHSQPPSPQMEHSEPLHPFRHFGRELPKAYQVLEEAGYDTSAPPEYDPSPSYTNLASPPPFLPRSPSSTRAPSLPRSPTRTQSPPNTAATGFSFFGGGPKRAASPPPEMPEPAKMEEVRDVLRGCKRVVVIGVHGWFPGAMIRTVLGEPTGTSSKFANMMALALHQFELEMDVKFEKVTKVVLEGEGEVKRRVDKLYSTLLAHPTHLNDIHRADAILIATHSQGSVVSTHILDRLIKDGHIVTRQSLATQMFGPSGGDDGKGDDRQGDVLGIGGEVYPGLPSSSSTTPSTSTTPANDGKKPDGLPPADLDAPPLSARTTSSASAFDDSKPRKPQRVCCLAMCGIHLGPLRYLNNSGFVGPYIQYLESHAARELFEFQNTESAVSKAYVKALEGVLDAGVKMVYVASLNDQVVPIYSGLFTAVHHPSILRALYIDGDAYSSSDFLCALLVLLIRIINAGLPDSGLIAHLSEATAGSLSGVGHSTAYEELATYVLAVKYLFLVDEGAMANVNTSNDIAAFTSPASASTQTPYFTSPTFSTFSTFSPLPHSPSPHPSSPLPPLPKPRMHFTPFSAHVEKNDYEIPWSLRDLIAHPIISYLFHREIEELRDKFGEWNPKTAVLRDVKRKVSPIARLGSVSSLSMGMGMGGYGYGGGSKL